MSMFHKPLSLFDKLYFQTGFYTCAMSLLYPATKEQTVLFNFINLTQVHNFTVSAQDIFTFRRLSVFTVSFTGISQVLR